MVVAQPRGPRPLLPGRLLLDFRHDPVSLMMKIAREYGDIARYKFARVEVYQLNHPDYIKEVLVTTNRDYIKPPFLRRFRRVLGEGLLTSEGEYHDRQRRLMRPAFHTDSIHHYGRIMTEYAQEKAKHWNDGDTLEIHHEMMRLTLSIIMRTMFSTEVEEEANRIGDAVTTIIEYMNSMIGIPLQPLVERLPIPSSRRFKHALEEIDGVIQTVISEHRSSGEKRHDLLSMLLDAMDPEDQGAGMNDVQLRDEAFTIFSAGHETTANLLSWTLYLLSEHPDVEVRLHRELDSVLAGRTPTVDDVRNLVYTEMILNESMRLYPPAWIIGREAIRDTTIGSYHLAKGAVVLMSQFVMHRDPRYFVNPERFDPERWRPEMRAKLPAFAFFPFGGGSRVCIGEAFARMEAVLILATIAQQWRFRHVSNHKVELAPMITLRPKHGMLMTASKRVVKEAEQVLA